MDGTGITKEVGTVMRSFTGTELGPEDQTIVELESSEDVEKDELVELEYDEIGSVHSGEHMM